jgi:ferredoxin-NADP reductase
MNETDFFEATIDSRNQESETVLSLTLTPTGQVQPPWIPGAHVDILLPNGMLRQYSLCSKPEAVEWRVAVARETLGRGGSAYIHDELRAGTKVKVRPPRSNFALAPAPDYLFIAGGIGITPILPMVGQIAAEGKPWHLVYLGRSRQTMAFLKELEPYGDHVEIHASEEKGRFPLQDRLAKVEDGTHLYACGPARLLDEIASISSRWEDRSRLHLERFTATTETDVDSTDNEAFTMELADGTEVPVPSDMSALEALENAGVLVFSSCREGICGTCETRVLAGEIDHRDTLLSDEEKAAMDTMMVCVSRGRTKLILDI